MARPKKYRGSCLCGAIKFSFTGTLDDAYFCHCTQCRKNFGMHGAFAGVARQALAIADPQETLKSYKSSRNTIRSFCGRCGSPISWDRRGNENNYVCLGLLEGRAKPAKIKNIHTSSKGAYYEIR